LLILSNKFLLIKVEIGFNLISDTTISGFDFCNLFFKLMIYSTLNNPSNWILNSVVFSNKFIVSYSIWSIPL
jgi:hypothetical protein